MFSITKSTGLLALSGVLMKYARVLPADRGPRTWIISDDLCAIIIRRVFRNAHTRVIIITVVVAAAAVVIAIVVERREMLAGLTGTITEIS